MSLTLAALAGQAGPVRAADPADTVVADSNASVDIFVRDHGKDALVNLLAKALAACAEEPDGTAAERIASPIVREAEPKSLKVAEYPGSLEQEGNRGHQAVLNMLFLVDALGNARFVHIEDLVSSETSTTYFTKSSIEAIRNSKFAAATEAGASVARWKHVRIRYITTPGELGNIFRAEDIRAHVTAARNGDAQAQHLVAYLSRFSPEAIGLSADERRQYFARGSVVGERNAQDWVADQLLGTIGCTPPPVILDMLRVQAWSGHSKIELLLAAHLLETAGPTAFHNISVLLHGAARSNDSFVQMWAAGLLATAPIDQIRDPPFALQIAEKLDLPDDPDMKETQAAALAANDRFDEAVKVELRALEIAKSLRLKDAQFRVRLAQYQASRPWTGYLCDCTRLVPGEGKL